MLVNLAGPRPPRRLKVPALLLSHPQQWDASRKGAYAWKEQVLSGEAKSIRAIAEWERLAESYVRRILPLAFLAPDVTEAILDGRQPADLELIRLMKDIPLTWAEQRQAFGFTVRL